MTSTGKAKAGSQYVTYKVAQNLFTSKWSASERSKSMQEGYLWGGWTLNPQKSVPNRDAFFLANYYGYKIGENPKVFDHGSTFRGIDPRNATLATVLEVGKTPSRKPSVAGTSVHKFYRIFVKGVQQSLDRREEKIIEDERPGFLAMEREIAKK